MEAPKKVLVGGGKVHSTHITVAKSLGGEPQSSTCPLQRRQVKTLLLAIIPLLILTIQLYSGIMPLSAYNNNNIDVPSSLQYYYNVGERQSTNGINDSKNYKTIGPWTQYPEITFTNYQWLQPSEIEQPTIPRYLISKDFSDSVVGHPRYNASLWSTLEKNPDPDRPILAFLDAETCTTTHWPHFASSKNETSDTENGRPSYNQGHAFVPVNGIEVNSICALIDMALTSPAMTAHPGSRLVIIECETHEGPNDDLCLGPTRNASNYKQLVIGHLSKAFSEINIQDFGIAPFPVKTIEDFPRSKVCNESLPYLIAFKGRNRNNFNGFRKYFSELAKIRSDIFMEFGTTQYKEEGIKNSDGQWKILPTPKEKQSNETYYQLMTQSTFCPVPRGDNLFSVRFSEFLSAGCIPIIYANGWVLPYTRAIVDWQKVAVIIPQQHVHQTLDYIEHMTKEEICARRLKAYDFYHQYVKTGKERLHAIVQVMDERLRTGILEPFQYAPGIATTSESLKMYQDAIKQYKNNVQKIEFHRYTNSLPVRVGVRVE